MHGRNRSPGDRSALAGAGAAHSGYRSFGRGGGGGYRRNGQPKPSSYRPSAAPPPPLPPRRRADVLLEAGRLAAEYLVAKGLLPPMAGERTWLPEDSIVSEGGRASALSRLGRRRFDDEDMGFDARNQKGRGGKRRQRNGSFNRHGTEWGKENGRGGPWPEATWTGRGRVYSDAMDTDDLDRPLRLNGRARGNFEDEYLDGRGGFEEDARQGGGSNNGGEGSIASSVEEPSMSTQHEIAGRSDSEPESDGLAEDQGPEAMNNSEVNRNRAPESSEALYGKTDDARVSDSEMIESGELRDDVESSACAEAQMKLELPEDVANSAAQSSSVTEDNRLTTGNIDLLSLCGFAKVPTKPRTMAVNRSPKGDQTTTVEVGKDTNGDGSVDEGLVSKMEKVYEDTFPGETLADQSKGPRGPSSEISTGSTSSDPHRGPQSSRDLVPEVSLSPSSSLGKEPMDHDLLPRAKSRCTASDSFPCSNAFVCEQQDVGPDPSDLEFSGKATDAKVDEDVGELVKREGMNQMQGLLRSLQPQIDLGFHDLRAKPLDLPAEKLLPDHEIVSSMEAEQLSVADSYPTLVADSDHKLEKERELASSSFKICDLNLMEAPEVAEIPNDPVLENIPIAAAPLVSASNLSMEFGLSIGQQCNGPDGYGHYSSAEKITSVIDVEDSPLQVLACDTSKSGNEAEYSNLDNFLNHPENPVGMPDIQDGYSLMSDFLGNDMAGCTSVQGHISNLQAGIPFHGAEGIPVVDESALYVGFAESPIGFMDVWDQGPPEYGKYF